MLRLVLAAALAAATVVPAQARPADRLLVCNKADHNLSIFDPAERREVAVLPTGTGPHEVAVSPDGTRAVVTNYGDQRPGSSLLVVDVVAGKALRTLELPRIDADSGQYLRPHGVQFVDARHVIVTSESTRRLVRVDLEAGIVTHAWPTPQSSMHMVALTADGALAFASSIRDGNVALFTLAGAEPPRLVATGDGAEGLAVHPQRHEAWIGNRAADTLSVVDGKSGAVVAELETGSFPFRVAFTPDGKQALVTCAEAGDVDVFDTGSRQRVRSIAIAGDASEQSPLPMGITVDPDGARAYVACGRGGFVAVVDLAAGKVVDRLPARGGPDGVAYARPAKAAVTR